MKMDFIEMLKYILLGFVQGFTETIPVSSSGHLMIVKSLMDLKIDFDTLAIITNFGSLIAIIILFLFNFSHLYYFLFSILKWPI